MPTDTDTPTPAAGGAGAHEMEAGRALDALIAEHIMGWRRAPYSLEGSDFEWADGVALIPPDKRTHITSVTRVPEYSTDIAAAWEVVEKIAGRNGDTIVSVTHNSSDGERMGGEEKYFCTIEDVSDGIEEWEASAMTAPLAICRAALSTPTGAAPDERMR